MKNKGFTLIELLVAISIIAILVTISVLVYSQISINSRDQRRVQDINIIKQALELYRRDNSSYPQSSDNKVATLSTVLTPYLPTLPEDPLATTYYKYRAFPDDCTAANNDCTSYIICARRDGNNSSQDISECSTPPTQLFCGPQSTDSCRIGKRND